MKYYCDECGSNETYVKTHIHEFKKNNHVINLEIKSRFCKKCDNEVYDSELDSKALSEALHLYNQKYGISEDIKRIRKEIGLSLEELSSIIGCAKKTLISYEKGESIPNDTYLIIIKTILDNPETIKTLISANTDMFELNKLNKINIKLDNYFSNNSNSLFLGKDTEASEYNGYTKTDFNKLISIINILSKEGMNKTKIIKELFFIDFLSYKLHCCSITGLEYAKLPYGPVIDDYKNIFETLLINNIIDYKVDYNNNYESHIIKSKIEPDLSIFRKDELDIIYRIKEFFKDFKVKDIVEYSHNEKAFKDTIFFDKISYDYAFDLTIN